MQWSELKAALFWQNMCIIQATQQNMGVPKLIVSALCNIAHVVQLSLHQALLHLQLLDACLQLCYLSRVSSCTLYQFCFDIGHICTAT